MIVWMLAVLAVLAVLFAAPLVFGSHVVVRSADRPFALAWFGFLTLLLLAAPAGAALALVLAAR